jgi:hypothetical protein
MRYLTNLGTEGAILGLTSAALYPRILFSALPFSVTFGDAIEIVQRAVGRNGELAGFYADIMGVGIGTVVGLFAGAVLRAFAEGHKET